VQARYDFCETTECRSRASSDYNDAKDRTIVREGIGFGMVTIGLVAGAVGAALLATNTSKPARASLVPLVGTTNGAALSGSF
jgi:hypothetical protein